jgi:hypothetical protein
MAPKATNHQPGRTARIVRQLLRSREHLVFALVAEAYLFLLNVPPWMHLLVVAVLHLGSSRRRDPCVTPCSPQETLARFTLWRPYVGTGTLSGEHLMATQPETWRQPPKKPAIIPWPARGGRQRSAPGSAARPATSAPASDGRSLLAAGRFKESA